MLEARGEVQGHGFTFERWVRETFFDGHEATSYTQRWDVSAVANLRHGSVPVSIKATTHGGALNLGDALRQFQIDEPFLLIVGFWRHIRAFFERLRPTQAVLPCLGRSCLACVRSRRPTRLPASSRTRLKTATAKVC